MKIRQCGCHVYCKEDAESRHRARNYVENTIPSNSEYPNSLNTLGISLPIPSAPAVSTGQEVEQVPMTRDALNNSRENILLQQMQEPNPKEDKSNIMCLKPSSRMSKTSGQGLGFAIRGALKVSESEMLFYVCEDNKCNYFEWWIPELSRDENQCCENGGQELHLPEMGCPTRLPILVGMRKTKPW